MIDIGGIYRVVPMDPGEPAALVLATSLDEPTQSVAVALLSPDIELGGSADLLLAPEDSGLKYNLLVESDIFGYVWVVQLDRALGRVSQSVLDSLAALRDDDRVGYAVAGPPIIERSDPRWTFKLHELKRLQRLTSDCTTELMNGEPVVASVDPAALRAPRTAHEVGVFEEFVLEVIEGVGRGDTVVPGWLVDISLDDELVEAYREIGCFHLLRTLWSLADPSEAPPEREVGLHPSWESYRTAVIEVTADRGRSSQWFLSRSTDVAGQVEVHSARTRDGRLVQVSYSAAWSSFATYGEVAA